eukprot:gene5628-biopygen7890
MRGDEMREEEMRGDERGRERWFLDSYSARARRDVIPGSSNSCLFPLISFRSFEDRARRQGRQRAEDAGGRVLGITQRVHNSIADASRLIGGVCSVQPFTPFRKLWPSHSIRAIPHSRSTSGCKGTAQGGAGQRLPRVAGWTRQAQPPSNPFRGSWNIDDFNNFSAKATAERHASFLRGILAKLLNEAGIITHVGKDQTNCRFTTTIVEERLSRLQRRTAQGCRREQFVRTNYTCDAMQPRHAGCVMRCSFTFAVPTPATVFNVDRNPPRSHGLAAGSCS